jgi:uncharacterized protein YxjI
MKQNWLSWGDDYTIKDEHGRDAFIVDGKVFTLRKTLVIEDLQGRELATIQKKILSFGPTFEVYRAGRLEATVKKSLFTLFKCEFTLDLPGPDDPVAEGSFLEYEYTFTRRGRVIATVSKRFFSWTDSYGIEVAPGQDDVLILAAVVVIDQCCHEEK